MSLSSNIRRARPLLGTLVEIGVCSDNADAAMAAAFEEIEVVHRLMSFHDPNSDVSRINRAPAMQALTVDARTWAVLDFARQLHRLSAGAFDVTAGSTLVEAGFLPAPDGAVLPGSDASQDDLLLLPENQVMLRKRLWVDLGGIAKGYAVDRAVAELQARGTMSGIVNAGGDLRIFGAAQPIHIRHPQQPLRAFPLGLLEETAVASSSGCYSSVEKDGRSIDPLVGRDRRCHPWRGGVTVIAPTCMAADALTKTVRLVPRRAAKLLREFGAQAIMVNRRGKARLLPHTQH